MKLYHFTAAHLIDRIKKDGLTLGCIPLSIDPPNISKGYQWLTANKLFDQEWCKYSTLPYNRNDYRITIKIPKSHRDKLIPWIPLWEELKKHVLLIKHLNDFGDPENWYVFNGNIPTEWFRQIIGNGHD